MLQYSFQSSVLLAFHLTGMGVAEWVVCC